MDTAEELLVTPAVEVPVIEAEAVEPEKGAEAEAEPVKAEEAETEKVVESPSTETQEPATVPIAAMHGERDRRQAIQTEFDAYKEKHPEAQAEPLSPFDDGFTADLRSELSQGLTDTLLNEGKGEAVRQYDQETVDTAEKWFIVEAQKSPMLAAQLQDVPLLQQHRKVVDIYKTETARTEAASDPAAHDAEVGQAAVEAYKAGLVTEAADKKAVIDSIPKSLVGDPSKGVITSDSWSGPTPLENVIG